MKMYLQSYVKIYNMLDHKTCEQTIQELSQCEWQQHSYTTVQDYNSRPINGDKELDVTEGPVSTSKFIENKVWESYKRYLESLNFHWFLGWKSFTDIRFNRYSQGQIMSEHCDHINSIFDGERKGVPTMTALGCLNEDYEGGQLVMFEDTLISLNTGDIMVFPSNFLFPHKVLPVTSGIRYSFVCWSW